jgi:hypothetical protein
VANSIKNEIHDVAAEVMPEPMKVAARRPLTEPGSGQQ